MASSSLLPNKQFNKLKVNRLDAQQIKSDSILPTTPSYLFSAIFNNSTFERTNTGGTLTVTDTDTESIIQFSDRPFRQTSNISFDAFVSLFKVSTGDNTFNEDPPNGVLTHSEEQRTYKITLLNYDLGSATFNLDLLPDETHNLNTITGRMNLFVDPADFFEGVSVDLLRNLANTYGYPFNDRLNVNVKKAVLNYYNFIYEGTNDSNNALENMKMAYHNDNIYSNLSIENDYGATMSVPLPP